MQRSAGVLAYRRRDGAWEVLLAHPGGPFWRNRDDGAWTIPKGAICAGETAEAAARREFEEELGAPPPTSLRPLGQVRQKSGKWVEAFAAEGDFDVAGVRSNRFTLEWPPHSGRIAEFPEIDRAAWFGLVAARRKILPGQVELLDHLERLLAVADSATSA